MHKIKKFLRKLSEQERVFILAVLNKIYSRSWETLDIKRLAGYRDIYRVRKGPVRVIFLDTRLGIQILTIERRSDHTYD